MGKIIAIAVAILIYIGLNVYSYKHCNEENKNALNAANAYTLGLAVAALIRTLIERGII